MKGRRFLVLHLPQVAIDRIRQNEPELAGLLVAIWDTHGNRRVLTGVDAPGTTLHVGQALADAQAMYPVLVLRPADMDADMAFLERLALWALSFTPIAAVDPPDGLVLDVTGCTDLVGGEGAMLRRVSDRLRRSGVACHGVIAGIVAAAAALARAGHHARIVPAGDEIAAVATLPIGTLRLSPDCIVGLNRLGLQRIGELLRQPRGPLTRRFGRALMDVLDGLTGDRLRTLSPVRPHPVFVEVVNFLEPIVTRPAIDCALDALLEPLCRALANAGQGARQVTLRAFRVDHDVQEITIGTSLPTRVPAHLRRLFSHELERLEPDLGFERMTLGAGITNTMVASQALMTTAGLEDARRAEALAQLIDRLSQRLPVWRLAPRESHWPERTAVRLRPFELVPHVPRRSALPAPVRLLRRPTPLMVMAVVPDGPPVQLRLNGAVRSVTWCDGPERIEREWWHDPEDRSGRDYFRVELASGARLWIGRAAARRPDRATRWFLHGYFA
jgi:protein ImuB